MPRNSTGNYTLPLPPVVSGELIEATWANTTLDDIGQAITDSLDRYGRGGMLASFLFADGTETNPGAAWANAPGTGFFRNSNYLGFSWNGNEIFNYNANGITVDAAAEVFVSKAPSSGVSLVNRDYVTGVAGAYLPLAGGTMTGDITFDRANWNIGLRYRMGDTQNAAATVEVTTPDGLGRAALVFNNTTNGAGSDSSIEFWTNWFGNSRAKRVQIDPNGLTRFYAGARVEYGSAFGWISDAGADAWRMDIDTAENMYIYNVGLAKSQLTLQGDGSTVVNGGALVAQQGTTFNFRNIGNTSNAWVMGAADFYGNDTFGIYNAVMGTWFLTVNPTLNYAEFTNSVRAPYLDTPNTSTGDLVTITAAGDPSVRFVKNGLSDSTISATSNGHLSVAVNGSYVATFQNDGNLRANSAFYANGPIFAGVVDSNVEKNIGFTGNQGVSAPYFYFNGDATGVGLYWALVGILWRYDRVSGNVSFDSPVSVRAKQFVASSVP